MPEPLTITVSNPGDDLELAVISKCWDILQPLDLETRTRVLEYLNSRNDACFREAISGVEKG